MICCCARVIFVFLFARSCSAAGWAMMSSLTKAAKAGPQEVGRRFGCSCASMFLLRSVIRFTLHVLLLFGGDAATWKESWRSMARLDGSRLGACISFLLQCSCQKALPGAPKAPRFRKAGPVEVVLQSLWSQTNFKELEGLLGMVLRLQAPARTADPVKDAKKAFVPGCCCRAASLSCLACCRARA